jgi:membrane-bound metal-dependent hydrolase YbcI (DUF457 family)
MDFGHAVPVTWRKIFVDPRIRRFWQFGLVGLFLHGVADPLVTYLVGPVYGVGIETNRWLSLYLSEGPVAFVAIHLPLYIFAIAGFCVFTWLFVRASPKERDQLYKLSLIVWGLIILWGVVIVANNLLVLASGLS